jgi:hypothetical protein
VFDRIVAPAKELLVFEVDRHLLFNECVELVTGPLVDRVRRLVAVPETVEANADESAISSRAPWSVGPRSRPTGPVTIAGGDRAFAGVASGHVATADISR